MKETCSLPLEVHRITQHQTKLQQHSTWKKPAAQNGHKHKHQTKRSSTNSSTPAYQPAKETCNVGPAHQQYKPILSQLVQNYVFGFIDLQWHTSPGFYSTEYNSFVALYLSLCLCMCKHLLLRLSHDLHDSLGGESLLSIENMKRPKDSSASVLMVQLDIFFIYR